MCIYIYIYIHGRALIRGPPGGVFQDLLNLKLLALMLAPPCTSTNTQLSYYAHRVIILCHIVIQCHAQ